MKSLRVAWRLLRLGLHVLGGMLMVATRFKRAEEAGRHQLIQGWSQRLLGLAGITLEVSGSARAGGGLLVANHISWLDIPVLHAACPQARFVSKAEVRRWPAVGWLAAAAGTLFIERERKRDAMRMVHAMAEALQGQQTVAIFPEGTTGPGPALLPLHANLLQAAIAVHAPIQPAVLRFASPDERFAQAVQYVGETTLLQSIWWVLSAPRLTAHVHFLSPLATAHADRRALAAHLQALMQAHLDEASCG